MDLTKLAAALVAVGNAGLAFVLAVTHFGWTPIENGAAFLVVNTTVAFGVSVYAHVRPQRPGYPVAVGVSFLLWSDSVLGLLTVHAVFGLTKDQAALAQGVFVALVGLIALFASQSKVTPVEDSIARERVAMDAHRRRP
jgi:hypothetical protein